MEKTFQVNQKQITICYEGINQKCPVVFLNNYEEETAIIYNECRKRNTKKFVLVGISKIDWNREMSPWFATKTFKGGEDYQGEAELYLEELLKDILPKVESTLKSLSIEIDYYAIAGYSLAALFALYTTTKTQKFQRVSSSSASLWYNGFLEYMRENKEKIKAEKIYLSLGNRESKTKNPILSTVEEKTKELYNILKEQTNCTYEENAGNHFQEEVERIAKGIKWIID